MERKQALIALTERLIEIESVDADQLREIIDENLPGPLLVKMPAKVGTTNPRHLEIVFDAE